ncbi:MAG: hypothetical protein RLZZ524_3007 [Pseudomonadota bacterium]|jgi:hypothetical protein
MADLAIRADLKLATLTLAAVDAATAAAAEDGLRPHLGASLIGRACDRALWYGWRWASAAAHEPRVLRLFKRGQDEEQRFGDLLRAAGITVHLVNPATGRQFSFAGVGGHFGGSMDGACVGVHDAPKTWHCLEFKTASAKMFNDLAAKGVQASKPEHWAQMQCYMAWAGLERALYCAVCKDDDRLHLERVDFDRESADALFARAERIITAPTPPDGISTDPAWYECRWCDHRELCHGQAAPLPTCRSCSHATAEMDGAGTWTCARHSGKTLSTADQKAGCQAHRYIPILLKNIAEPVDASDKDNWVKYRLKEDGAEFVNGTPPAGFESTEIHASQHKTMLADPQVKEIRKAWQRARVTA